MNDPDEKSKRDSKGLTFGHRTMLRLLVEFGRTARAAEKIGDSVDFGYIASAPVVLSRIQDLLGFATELGRRIGSEKDIIDYLNQYDEEDAAIVRKIRKEHEKVQTHANAHQEALQQAAEKMVKGGELCLDCGNNRCAGCDKCHYCDGSIEAIEGKKNDRVLN